MAAPDDTTLALQAMRQREQIDAALKGLGSVEDLRQQVARADAQRAFAAAFLPERLRALQESFARLRV